MQPDPTSLDIEQPFPAETPPSLSVEHAPWREARASLDFLVTSGRRDFVISGDERAGKSQFIAWAERNYGDAVRLHEASRDGVMPSNRPGDGAVPTPIFIRRATPDEIVFFLHERLRQAAFAPETLSRAATDAIVAMADGSVGRANELASVAFDSARARQARRVDRRDVGGRGRPDIVRSPPDAAPVAPARRTPAAVPSRAPRRRLFSVPFLLEGLVVLAAGAFVVFALPNRDQLFSDGLWQRRAPPPAPFAAPPVEPPAAPPVATTPSGDAAPNTTEPARIASNPDATVPPSPAGAPIDDDRSGSNVTNPRDGGATPPGASTEPDTGDTGAVPAPPSSASAGTGSVTVAPVSPQTGGHSPAETSPGVSSRGVGSPGAGPPDLGSPDAGSREAGSNANPAASPPPGAAPGSPTGAGGGATPPAPVPPPPGPTGAIAPAPPAPSAPAPPPASIAAPAPRSLPPDTDAVNPPVPDAATANRTALPPGDRAPLLVTVRYPAGALGAALAAEHLATRLTDTGVAVDGPSALRGHARPGISYAFAEDAAAASRLAASLGPELSGAVPEAMSPEDAVDARPGQIDIVVTGGENGP